MYTEEGMCSYGRSFYEHWDWKRECFLIKCGFCGNIYICSDIMRCPCCDSGNLKVVPFRNHVNVNISWLKHHGFPFIDRVMVE
jgi:hypothetical protein